MHTHKKFYVYSKSGCGFCDRLTSFMDQNNVQYEKFTLGTDYTTDEFLNKFGSHATFPQVHYESQKIGGMKDTVRFLVENKLV